MITPCHLVILSSCHSSTAPKARSAAEFLSEPAGGDELVEEGEATEEIVQINRIFLPLVNR